MSSAGQAVGGVVGAVAGFFLGGGPTGALYGAQAGMMLGGLLHPPKGPTVDGPRLNDLSVQTSTYGAVIPRVYGAITVDGNVFWLENNSIKETITKKKSGGKGGGAKTTTRTYSYSATFAVGLCKGPVVGIRRLWIGANLVYDAGSSDTNTIVASNQAATGFRLYTGTDTQQPDARMQATLGVANTPAWRGLCYLVFYDLDLTKYGNSLLGAQVRAEVLQSGAIYTYPYTAFSGLSAYYWHSPVWDGTVYCSVAYFQHAVVASTDGLSWQQYAIPNGGATNYQGTASDGAGTLLAYGVNQVWRSTDHGVTWTGYSLPGFVGYTTQIVWNGTTFLAITDTGNFFTSPNGITWTAQTPPAGLGSYGRTLCWNGSMWFVRPTFGTGREIWSSPSGATGSWTLAYTMPGDFNNHNLCAVLNGRVLYMGMGTVASYGPCAVWSDDGASWSYHAMPQSGDSLLSDGTNFWTEHGGVAYYSADGITWTYWTGPAQGTNYKGGYGNGFIVYLGNSGGVGFRITKQFASALPATLGAIVGAECLQSGLLAAGDIDVSALTSGVYGYRVASVGAIRAALEPLQAAWPFDVVQRGYVIRFVARGGSSVVTIPQTDLDARGAGASAGVQITTSREMDSQIPRKVTVQYLDLDREYNALAVEILEIAQCEPTRQACRPDDPELFRIGDTDAVLYLLLQLGLEAHVKIVRFLRAEVECQRDHRVHRVASIHRRRDMFAEFIRVDEEVPCLVGQLDRFRQTVPVHLLAGDLFTELNGLMKLFLGILDIQFFNFVMVPVRVPWRIIHVGDKHGDILLVMLGRLRPLEPRVAQELAVAEHHIGPRHAAPRCPFGCLTEFFAHHVKADVAGRICAQ